MSQVGPATVDQIPIGCGERRRRADRVSKNSGAQALAHLITVTAWQLAPVVRVPHVTVPAAVPLSKKGRLLESS